jgi:hypothetical protein
VIDTIISITRRERFQELEIEIPTYDLTEKSFFHVHKSADGIRSNLSFRPTKNFIEEYGYFPSIDLMLIRNNSKNAYEIHYIKIQCSVPKLIFGSSYYMVKESHLFDFCKALHQKLNFLGIQIPLEKISKLGLSQVAICFNAEIPEELGNVNNYIERHLLNFTINQHYKNKRHSIYDEENFGICFREYSQNVSYKIYDKVAEIKANSKSRTEKRVLEDINSGVLPKNILRFEKTYQRISALKKALKVEVPKIEDVFNTAKCRFILLDFIGKIFSPYEIMMQQIFAESNENPKTNIALIMERIKGFGFTGKDIYIVGFEILSSLLAGRKESIQQIESILGRNGQKLRSKNKKEFEKIINLDKLKELNLYKVLLKVKEQIISL